MLLIYLLLVCVTLVFCYSFSQLWGYFKLSQWADRVLLHVWLKLPARLRRITERNLVISMAGSKPHISFFIWSALGCTSICFSLLLSSPLIVAFFLLLLLMVINKRRRVLIKRNKTLTKELPDFCDLISMMMASGVPLILALEKVAESCSERMLAVEIMLVIQRLRRGVNFKESMMALTNNCDAKAIKEWGGMLVKAHEQGASLTKPLRFFAHQLRQELLNRAEKRAQEAPVKLLFPLVTCFFPVNFLVILGPIILQISQGGFT